MNGNPWQARWSKNQLKALLIEQFKAFWRRESGVERRRLADLVAA